MKPLEGVRVVELGMWLMVPAVGAILADWGADVIKVESSDGDPIRGLNALRLSSSKAPVNYTLHQANRGKRSVAVDCATKEGIEVLYQLVEGADVFLTSFLPDARGRLKVEVDDIRRRNPNIIYARGSALGPRGPERRKGGFDWSTFWCRGGLASSYHSRDLEYPLGQTGGFGDLSSSVALAGGIATALFHRERHGVTSVVDTSLLAMSTWTLALDVAAAARNDQSVSFGLSDRYERPNPTVNIFKTSDGRFLTLVLIQSDRNWPELCQRLDRTDLIADPRFSDSVARGRNSRACTEALDEIFATRSLAEWKKALAGAESVWDPVQDVSEVVHDPQVVANDYLVEVDWFDETAPQGVPTRLIAPPVQFDEMSTNPRRTPEHGEHTETLLLELGYSWEEIAGLKERRVVP